MYVITGATGNTGSVISQKLLENGAKIRVIGRDAKKLERFTQKGAEPFVADVTDAAALVKAFSGATAAYAMIPPNVSAPDVPAYMNRVSDALTDALTRSRVTHAVVLSSFGADKPDSTGPVVGLHNLEDKLGRIASLNALFLRPGYFMENLLPQINVIQSFGMMAGPVRPDLPLPFIATRDIGMVAADSLLKLGFTGKQHRELLGPRDVTYMEVASIVGAAIGKPDLTYQQLPPAQLKPALMQMGMSSSMADELFELADALDSGHIRALEPRSQASMTPTTIETFISESFVQAYRGKAARA